MKSAVRTTGFSEFGEDFNKEPLDVLLGSINEESRLHPFGFFVSRLRLKGALENRLRGEYWFARYPEILEQELAPVFVITGLQRTGTTMLHRLLASDPDTRPLYSWEALNPAPIPGMQTDKERQKRIQSAVTSQNALAYIAPDFFAVHPVEATSPEEDCLLLDASFLSTVPEATLRVPGYSKWLESQDQKPAYEYMKKLMLLLQWQQPGKRWILKTPHHMEYLETLCEVFPGVRIIQTHRDPAVTMPSFCSMISHGRGVFSNNVDPVEIGRNWGRKVRRMTDRTMRFRDKAPAGLFYDIYYEDLVENPIAEVRKIYTHFGLEWTGDIRHIMGETNEVNFQYKYGRHTYRLEDFGLSEQQIRIDFSEYYEKYFDPSVADKRLA